MNIFIIVFIKKNIGCVHNPFCTVNDNIDITFASYLSPFVLEIYSVPLDHKVWKLTNLKFEYV